MYEHYNYSIIYLLNFQLNMPISFLLVLTLLFFYRNVTACLLCIFICLIIPQNPLAMDLVLNLPSDGFRLVFDPAAQRLKVLFNS